MQKRIILSIVIMIIINSQAFSGQVLDNNLMIAASQGDIINVKKFIAEGANINQYSGDGYPLYMVVIIKGLVGKNTLDYKYQNILQYLFLKGANVNLPVIYRDGTQISGLSVLILLERNDVVRLLITKPNINVNYQNSSNGTTPIIDAASVCNLEAIRMLAKRANLNIKSKDKGQTLLTFLVGKKNCNRSELNDLIKMLISNGANVNLKDDYGKTALDYAYEFNDYKSADILCKYGAKSSVCRNLQQENTIDSSVRSKPKIMKTKNVGGIHFVYIEGGSFIIGSEEIKYTRNEKVKGFWISKFEMAQEQYQSIMGINPSNFKGVNLPVEMVSWEDAMSFCEKFSSKNNVLVRLPHEVEWEYACKAGTMTNYYWGDSINNDYCWNEKNSDGKTHPVGQKKPNNWNLYDMSGNVNEWCLESYEPIGAGAGFAFIQRGGSYMDNLRFNTLKSAVRSGSAKHVKSKTSGFRIVLVDSTIN